MTMSDVVIVAAVVVMSGACRQALDRVGMTIAMERLR